MHGKEPEVFGVGEGVFCRRCQDGIPRTGDPPEPGEFNEERTRPQQGNSSTQGGDVAQVQRQRVVGVLQSGLLHDGQGSREIHQQDGCQNRFAAAQSLTCGPGFPNHACCHGDND
jgi:hypothetical protein